MPATACFVPSRLGGKHGSVSAPWKMPPLIKVYEALGAFGDGRVRIVDDRRALVTSSDGSKTYEVEIADRGREISSNDNASYWQGYLGYPAIAALLLRGMLDWQLPASVTDTLAAIPWKELNRRFRNDYAQTLAAVDAEIARRGCDPQAVRTAAEAILERLAALAPGRGPRRRPPKEAGAKH